MKKINLANSKIVKDSFLSIISKGYAMVLFLLTDIVLARLLGIDEYAEWNFFYSLADMIFPIVWFGINVASRVYVARCNNEKEMRIGVQGTTILRIGVSAILALIYAGISIKLPYYIGYPNKYDHLKLMIQLNIIYIFINSIAEFYKDLNIALRNFKNILAISILEFTGYLCFSVLFLLNVEKSAVNVEIAYMCATVAIVVLEIAQFRRLYSVEEFRENRIEILNVVKLVFKDAFPFLLISCGTLILVEMDSFMIGLMKDSEEIATYSIAKKFCSKATHINIAICASTMPIFAKLSYINVDEMKQKFKKIMSVNLGFTTMVGLVFWLIVPPLIPLFYGKEYSNAGIVLIALIPYYVFNGVSKFLASFLDYQRLTKRRGLFYLSAVVLNLVFNLLLIPRQGAFGAALASSLSMIPYLLYMIIETGSVFKKFGEKANEKK